MQLGFYLVTDGAVETALAQIAGKVLENGERLLVVSGDEAQRDAVAKALWDAAPPQFLANGADHPDRQPILIADHCEPANGAKFIALADGRWRDAAAAFERGFLFFDEAGRQAARDTYKALGDRDGVTREFFAREDGRWVKKG